MASHQPTTSPQEHPTSSDPPPNTSSTLQPSLPPLLTGTQSLPPLPEGEVEPEEQIHNPYADDSSSDEGPNLEQSVSTTADSVEEDALCVICFERPPEVTLEPCGHANLCLSCLSRLVKRRCPTCRARAKKVRYVDSTGESVTRTVREVIADRKRAEMNVLSSTLQIIFLGPPDVGKKALVRKLLAKYPLDNQSNNTTEHVSDEQLFSDGTDFAPNARMGGSEARLSVLRRTSLVSRRMMLEDVRVLKPDVLVLCCSAHSAATFDELQAWDRVLRSSFARSRVWALLADDNDAGNFAADPSALYSRQSVHSTISAISPPELRPRGHYLCTSGNAFNIGFRSLAKDVVDIARVARDEQFAAQLAAEEVRNIVAHQAAGTLSEQQHAASLVISANGVPVPAFAHTTTTFITSRTQTADRSASESNRNSLGIRALRSSRDAGTSASGNGAFSFTGLVKWFSGANGGAQ